MKKVPVPFSSLFVEGEGWTGAAFLTVGQQLIGTDGVKLTVVENLDEKHADGVQVYNFSIGGTHSYFVADGIGAESWAWVHNLDCSPVVKRPGMPPQPQTNGTVVYGTPQVTSGDHAETNRCKS